MKLVGLCALWTRRYGRAGIGFAASAAAAVNVAVLLGVLRRREGRLRGREMLSSLARIAAAAAVMGAALVAAGRWVEFGSWRGGSGALALSGTIVAASVVYWTAARLLGAPEAHELRSVARRRPRPAP